MKFLRKLLRLIGIRRTVTIACDMREWAFEVPKEAVLLGSAQRGYMGFFSWDVTLCGRATINFVRVAMSVDLNAAPSAAAPEDKGGDVEVLFDRTAKS